MLDTEGNPSRTDGRRIYEAEAERLRQFGWQERQPRLLPDLTLGEWDGIYDVDRHDGSVKRIQFRVVYWRGYPWLKPTIWPVDPLYHRTLHLSAPSTDDERRYAEKAGLGDRLCIWDDHAGWDPERAEQEIPKRIHGWFDFAEKGWPGTEGQILDPERYFGMQHVYLFAPDGLSRLKAPFGTVDIAASDRIGLIESIDSLHCRGYESAAASLRMEVKVQLTIPYVLLAHQPAVPVFETLRELRDEASRQGLDGQRLIQHLGRHTVNAASERDHPKPKKNKRPRQKNRHWPKPLTLSLPHASSGDQRLQFLLVYPVDDQLIGCQLILPKLKSQSSGFAGSKQDRLQASLNEKLLSGTVRSIDSQTLLKRNPRRMNAQPVNNATVMILGHGSVGSVMAELLTKAGVKRLVLADADLLEPGNVIRHACGMDGVGKPKAVAVRERLRSIRHDGEYEIIRDATGREMERCDIIQNLDLVIGRAAECALVLDCTGSEAVLQAVSRACRASAVPFMSVGTYYSAAVGQILAVMPEQSCLECLRRALGDRSDINVPTLKEDETVAAEGCVAVTSPASAADLVTTCSLASQACIEVLLGNQLGWHQRLWIGRVLQDAPADSVFRKAPQVVDSLIDASRCDLCQV